MNTALNTPPFRRIYRRVQRHLAGAHAAVTERQPFARGNRGDRGESSRAGAPADTVPAVTVGVVGMVGGGQLARMTAQAAIALGVRLRVLAALAGRIRSAGGRRRDDRRPRRAGRAARLRGRVRRADLRPRARPDRAPARRWRPRASPCGRGRRPCVHAQDKVAMRGAADRDRRPCPAWRLVERRRPTRRVRRPNGWPVVLKTPRGGYDGAGVCVVESRGGGGRLGWPRGPVLADGRGVGRSAGSWRCWWRAARTGRPRSIRSWRPSSATAICREVLAPAPDLRPEHAAGRAADRAADRRGARGRRCHGGGDVRHRRTGCWSTSSRCGRTTAATGPSTAP